MNDEISKEKIEKAFDNLCELFDYSTDKDVYDDFLYIFKEHQILFYEMLHNPENRAVTTIEEANKFSDSFTKQQQALIFYINEKRSCEELKALFFKIKNYIDDFYNLLSPKKQLELKVNLKSLGQEIFQKLEYLKFLEFEHLSTEITEKHQKLLKSMSKDSSFVKCNLNTKKFEINFSKNKSKNYKKKK
ncbi:hypothetical protein [Moritella viscosa]|uniref:Uncharacterized protein n=1 Tax=Moritella viscosa TaxID=80854 RepID=A0ABY1HJX3_9GAMM|nr:hypothetical protein [Moritella viscosa]SGZ03460.1 Putative uncharacterized protein [Moritella viscosa]SHO28232.1 Putative uncharacterized protein [Moritella viscosa]